MVFLLYVKSKVEGLWQHRGVRFFLYRVGRLGETFKK